MRSTPFAPRAAIMLVVLLAVACGQPAAQDTAADAEVADAATDGEPGGSAASSGGGTEEGGEQVVTFVSIDGLTGPSAAFGGAADNGKRLAADTVNAAGGFEDDCGTRYTIELQHQDMVEDRNQAITLVRRAAGDAAVLAVLGPTLSTGFVPAVPLAGELDLPVIGTGSVAAIPEWNEWAFRPNPTASVGDEAMLVTLEEQFDIEGLAILHDQSHDAHVGARSTLLETAGEIGVEVVFDEAFQGGTQDYSVQLAGMESSGADWFALLGVPADLGRMLRQMDELGIEAESMTTANGFANPEAWTVSGGLAEGGYSWAGVSFADASGEIAQFSEDYLEAFGEEPTAFSLYGFDSLMLAVDAVTRACTATDRAAFRDALAATDGYQGLGTAISFENPPTGENQSPTVRVTVTTGEGQFEAID